jgi:acetyl-CoA carboxylase beta subunit
MAEIDFHCNVYDRLKMSLSLKPPVCPAAVLTNKFTKEVRVCPKFRRNCLILAELNAEERATNVVDERDVQQTLALQELELKASPGQS